MILIVEDDPYVSRVLDQMLHHLGHTCVIFENAFKALNFMNEEGLSGIRMIISDYMLPDGNGTQLIRHARSLSPELPAAVISAYMNEPIPEAIEFIAKPFRFEQIKLLLERLLEN